MNSSKLLEFARERINPFRQTRSRGWNQELPRASGARGLANEEHALGRDQRDEEMHECSIPDDEPAAPQPIRYWLIRMIIAGSMVGSAAAAVVIYPPGSAPAEQQQMQRSLPPARGLLTGVFAAHRLLGLGRPTVKRRFDGLPFGIGVRHWASRGRGRTECFSSMAGAF